MEYLQNESKLLECLKTGDTEGINDLTAKLVNDAAVVKWPALLSELYTKIQDANAGINPVYGELFLTQVITNIEKSEQIGAEKEVRLNDWRHRLTQYRVRNGLLLDAEEKEMAEVFRQVDLERSQSVPELKYKAKGE